MTVAIVSAFLLGLAAELVFVVVADRRAVRRERQWWEQIRADALDGYGRVFDWEELGDA